MVEVPLVFIFVMVMKHLKQLYFQLLHCYTVDEYLIMASSPYEANQCFLDIISKYNLHYQVASNKNMQMKSYQPKDLVPTTYSAGILTIPKQN